MNLGQTIAARAFRSVITREQARELYEAGARDIPSVREHLGEDIYRRGMEAIAARCQQHRGAGVDLMLWLAEVDPRIVQCCAYEAALSALPFIKHDVDGNEREMNRIGMYLDGKASTEEVRHTFCRTSRSPHRSQRSEAAGNAVMFLSMSIANAGAYKERVMLIGEWCAQSTAQAMAATGEVTSDSFRDFVAQSVCRFAMRAAVPAEVLDEPILSTNGSC